MALIPLPRRRYLRTTTMLTSASDIQLRRADSPNLRPHNPRSRLAQSVWGTGWCLRSKPFDRSLLARRCKTIASAFERKHLGSPHAVKAHDIEAWIASRTTSASVAAGYRAVFRSLLCARRPRLHFIDAMFQPRPEAWRTAMLARLLAAPERPPLPSPRLRRPS